MLTPSVRNLANFYLTVDVENKNGLATTAYGLIFRISSGNLYFFAFSAESQVYNFTVLNNAKWRTIIDWQLSLQINQAGSNRIGVLAKGTSFYFFINGEMIDKAEDNTLKTGKVGVGLSFANTDGEMEIAFDNFEVRAPK